MGTQRFTDRWLKVLGANVRRHRVANGLSQAELAGLHLNTVSGIERGERNPPLSKLVALADALGVRLDKIWNEPAHRRRK